MLGYKVGLKQFFGFDTISYGKNRSPVEELRLKYIILSCRLGLIICASMIALSFTLSGYTADVTLGTYWISILLLTPFLLKKGVNIERATRIQGISFLIFVVFLVAKDLDVSSGRLYWAYIFPPISFFVNGKREGLFGSVILMLIMILLLNGTFVEASFTLTYRVRFFVTYCMVIGATYGVEFCRDAAIRKMSSIQDDYAQKVQQLTASEQALKSIQEKAIESAKLATLGEMAGGIAHEINNPLMVISGNAKLIKKRLMAGDASSMDIIKYADRVTETVDRLELIVRGLRSFIRAGKDDPLELVALDKIVGESTGLVREKIAFAQVSFAVDDIPGDAMIRCRETEILQVLLNLLENSLDAVKGQESSWIKISYESKKNSIGFAVMDSGAGIPEGIKDDIFNPFFTTKKVGKGVGLGLSITRDIIERHGGIVYVAEDTDYTKIAVEFVKA